MKVGLKPKEGGSDFDETIEQAVKAEAVGFDSVWFSEHYASFEEYIWPSPLLALAALASRTERIELGTNVLIAPFYHPVKLASSLSLLDVISDGRVVCGLGVGYDANEFRMFGIPQEESVTRTIESTILLKKLLTEESVSFDGRHFELDDVRVTPRPIRKPRPPIWYGVWGEYMLKQAATRADAWVPGAVADLDTLKEKQQQYRSHLPADERPTQPLLRDMVIADTDAEAVELAETYLGRKWNEYAGNDHPLFAEYHETPFEEFAQDRIIMGTAESCVEQINRFRTELDVDHLILRFYYPDKSHREMMEEIAFVGEEVLPEVR